MLNLFVLLDIISKGFPAIFLDLIPYFSIFFGVCVINCKNPVISVLFLIGLFSSIALNLILLGYNFLGLSYLLVYVGAVSILFIFILMLINIRISELLDVTNNNIALAVFICFTFGLPIYNVLNKIDLIKDKYKNLDLKSWLKSINTNDGTIINLNIEEDKHINTDSKNLNVSLNTEEGNIIINSCNIEKELSIENESGINEELNIVNELDIEDELNIKEELNEDIFFDLDMTDSHENLYDTYYVSSNIWDETIVEFSDITSVGNTLYTNYAIWLIICSIILLLAMIGAISITKKEKD